MLNATFFGNFQTLWAEKWQKIPERGCCCTIIVVGQTLGVGKRSIFHSTAMSSSIWDFSRKKALASKKIKGQKILLWFSVLKMDSKAIFCSINTTWLMTDLNILIKSHTIPNLHFSPNNLNRKIVYVHINSMTNSDSWIYTIRSWSVGWRELHVGVRFSVDF